MTRVLIVDDQAEVRSALRMVLSREPDLEVVDEATNGIDAIAKARLHRPDIVLLDIRMPDLDGIDTTRRLTERSEPHAPAVIALTTFDLDEYVFGVLQAGAAGFLLKDNEPVVLLQGIRAVARGHGLVDPQVTRRLIRRFAAVAPRQDTDDLARLTPREREVLHHLARGLSNAEIARALVVEEGTVKTHVRRILTKLGLRTRVHAVIYAYERGLQLG